ILKWDTWISLIIPTFNILRINVHSFLYCLSAVLLKSLCCGIIHFHSHLLVAPTVFPWLFLLNRFFTELVLAELGCFFQVCAFCSTPCVQRLNVVDVAFCKLCVGHFFSTKIALRVSPAAKLFGIECHFCFCISLCSGTCKP